MTVTSSTSQHFTIPEPEDGVASIASGGAFGQFLDLEGTVKNEFDLIARYRGMALQPECETAIDDIINEIIVDTGKTDLVTLNLSNLNVGDKVKKELHREFKTILRYSTSAILGTMSSRGGTLMVEFITIVSLTQQIPEGLTELRIIDSLKLKKVREEKRPTPEEIQDAMVKPIIPKFDEYYIYAPNGFFTKDSGSKSQIKISKDSIAYSGSGLMDAWT